VKLTGSIEDVPNAKRQSMELAAKAMRATVVQTKVLIQFMLFIETFDIAIVDVRILIPRETYASEITGLESNL
jgi:hypothetical protein